MTLIGCDLHARSSRWQSWTPGPAKSRSTSQPAFRLTTETFDDHDVQSSLTGNFPAGFPQLAEITFNGEWSGILDRQHIRNEAQNFEGDYLRTGSTIEWSAENSSGFQFTSEPADRANVVGAVIRTV